MRVSTGEGSSPCAISQRRRPRLPKRRDISLTGTLVDIGEDSLTGSGSVAIDAPSLAATGTFTTTGTGSVSIARPALAGSGSFLALISGSGAVTISRPTIAGLSVLATSAPARTSARLEWRSSSWAWEISRWTRCLRSPSSLAGADGVAARLRAALSATRTAMRLRRGCRLSARGKAACTGLPLFQVDRGSGRP